MSNLVLFLSVVGIGAASEAPCLPLKSFSSLSPSCFEPATRPVSPDQPSGIPSCREMWSSSGREPAPTGKPPCSWLARSVTMEGSAGRSCALTEAAAGKHGIPTGLPKSPASAGRHSLSLGWRFAAGATARSVRYCPQVIQKEQDDTKIILMGNAGGTAYPPLAVSRRAPDKLGRSPPVWSCIT